MCRKQKSQNTSSEKPHKRMPIQVSELTEKFTEKNFKGNIQANRKITFHEVKYCTGFIIQIPQ